MREYKAIIYSESVLSSFFLGAAKIDPERLTDFLNDYASQGWRVITMSRENRRTLLFSKREAYVMILERDKR